ncbi:FtsX-like permease family protein [Serpentinicella alkaliphila]|uniref:Putative ABC transport system permease protein n=1 Tax=Serpentinicella alkaliphila TaxID=1734049 RepID=A0A4R2TT21_9FIRM|nr:ABC transporter permease [Serpentinicella alkaliphila]QUH25229.1 ABC transporter permease [Serpentinicella alkaliphila]TCQ07038.1 putative ABC transport system permease protein [Serpentinicella alkaliphila]
MKILLNLVQKDFKKNRVITAVLAIFLILAFLLMAGGLRTTVTIISSISGLNQLAAPPQYLQMHKGAYDQEAFENFVKNHNYIKDSLVVKMLNIKNENIIYKGETLEKYLMDNGFIVQNEGFDFLLNMNNEIATVQKGEIGVPVYYVEELGIQVGDVITLKKGDYQKKLIVSTFIRDAQMNAALTSSKRFLVNDTDIEELSLYMGEWEYCFEFLLEEGASGSTLERDYMEAGMPSNGVGISGSLVTMLNAISHGLIAVIVIAISILLIMIAFLCLSYIIRATMAEESYTIGELKAIGFSGKEIEKLYQLKYIILVLVAALVGYIGAIPFSDIFSSSVIMYYGDGTVEWIQWVFSLVGVTLLSIFVILGCRRIIRKSSKRTVMELIRGEEKRKKEGHYSLPLTGLKHPNFTIALGELQCKWMEYTLIFMVYAFSSFLILLPLNITNTIKNPSFMTYMGVGESDIRIDIQYSEELEEQKVAVGSYLDKDAQVDKYAIYRYGHVQIKNREGEWERIRVENGDQSIFPLKYLKGSSPADSRKIALSYLSALELGKEVGDSIKVICQGEELLFTVSGIYQDITYGGKTAKAAIDFDKNNVEVYIVYLDVQEGVNIQEKANELRNRFNDIKITPVREFVSQTLGGITNNMILVERAAIVISLLLILLITTLILKLVIAREHSAIAIKKAIGFSNKDIRIQLGMRILMIQMAAILIGTIMANFSGEAIFGWMLSSMGASKIKILVEPVSTYLVYPAIQLIIVLLAVIVSTKGVKNYHIRNQIIE